MKSLAIRELEEKMHTYQGKVNFFTVVQEQKEEKVKFLEAEIKDGEHAPLEYKRLAENWEEAVKERNEAKRHKEIYQIFVSELSHYLNRLYSVCLWP